MPLIQKMVKESMTITHDFERSDELGEFGEMVGKGGNSKQVNDSKQYVTLTKQFSQGPVKGSTSDTKNYFKRIILITPKTCLSVLIIERLIFAKEIINKSDEFKGNNHFFCLKTIKKPEH